METYAKEKIRLRFCPACRERRAAALFHYSDRNPRQTLVCVFCRPSRARSQRRFWIVKELLDQIFGKEVRNLSSKDSAAQYLRFPEEVAKIIGKTYAVRGDDFEIEDDVALAKIRDLLDELDPTLITRNKNKRLSR